jgi:hypothetical protein
MSVQVADDRIVLEGHCPVEDAEKLLLALHDDPARGVDLRSARRLHLAVVQVLIAARARIVAPPEDPFLRQHVLPSFFAGSGPMLLTG